MPTLLEETKPVVLRKFEFEYRVNFKFVKFSWEISDYQYSHEREKETMNFWNEYTSTRTVFSIETLMQEIELAVEGNQEFENRWFF